MKFPLRRLAINRKGGTALIIESADRTASYSRLNSFATEEALRTDLRSKFAANLRSELHVHRNRDGTFAVSVGNEPETWPEDEK